MKLCPMCENELILHKGGAMKNQISEKFISIFLCEECDQAFASENNNLAIIPFDYDMKKIEHICIECGKMENYQQKIVFIVEDNMSFKKYCIDCGIEKLRNWIRKSNVNSVKEVIKENIHEIAQLHETIMMNKYIENGNGGKK